jgi:hypothetical protein
MSIFEVMMLICFGAAWPFSIARSWKSRSTAGKSIIFLWIVLAGYVSGIIHKLLYNRDAVIALYTLNSILVLIDIALYYRNRRLTFSASP